MGKPRLFGIQGSRALRSKWGIAEVGIDYELVRANFMTDAKSAGYRAINPSGRFPALIDGELTLFRAMAINVQLAKRYGGPLYPRSAEDEPALVRDLINRQMQRGKAAARRRLPEFEAGPHAH